jgi:MFS superfamily sulfate permease-like transporter
MAALLGVLGSGLLNGVLLGVVFSLLLLLGRASRPRVTELGRVPGTTYFADIARHPENERIDDVLVVRNEGALLYFNVDHVRERVSTLIAARQTPLHLLVFFMGNVPHVDLAGVEFLFDLDDKCRASGIQFRLAEVHGPVREAIRRPGGEHGNRLAEANQTVADILSQRGTASRSTA